MESYWVLPEREDILTPRKILVEQAIALAKVTRDHLRGTVTTTTTNGKVVHSLNIIVPSLNNYTYTLLDVRHGVSLYSCFVHCHAVPGPEKEAFSADSLIDYLKTLLAHRDVQKVLANLLAQADGY